MVRNIDIREFADLWRNYPVVDVRSPNEYRKGHIPGAYNLPLFSDEERAQAGTRYTRSGRLASVQLGLDLAGPRLSSCVKAAADLSKQGPLLMHCWRGGMRSSSMAWLLDLAGMDVDVLKGGYKAYRSHIRNEFSTPVPLIVLAGKTGCGKTEILQAVRRLGQQVIDLEQIAGHKGSVFGGLGMQPQPTNEQFENDLFEVWQQIDPDRPVWIEDESLSVGTVSIPRPLFNQMMASPVIEIDLDFGMRVARLIREYASFSADDLVSCIIRIERKLGGDIARKASEAVRKGEFDLASSILLTYYDKAYDQSLLSRAGKVMRTHVHLTEDDPEKNAHILLNNSFLHVIAKTYGISYLS
ncbi:MAG: tRNA 2-selenouridine(34) synthase MnmH [Bacteroidales bacterium]|nr:tRNA 2-selenouridine(34) synthase MnmH [Bacteroidales bacterium]